MLPNLDALDNPQRISCTRKRLALSAAAYMYYGKTYMSRAATTPHPPIAGAAMAAPSDSSDLSAPSALSHPSDPRRPRPTIRCL